MSATRKVLVIGDDTRSFLATVRSLGRHGLEVHAAPFDFRAPALASRYLRAVHRLPHYTGDGERWVKVVTRLLKRERFDFVIACDERSVLPFDRHRALFEADYRLSLPSRQAIEVLYDKHATREAAQATDVPVAPGRLLRAGDDAAGLVREFSLPLVVKPRRSYDVGHLHARSNVAVCRDPCELERALADLEPGELVVEGFFPGRGVGVSVLAAEGRCLQAFQHDRVHEAAEGGGSSYRISVPVQPALEAACARLLKAVDYSGVAMFEFRRNDDTGDWILLEVNARPWGSLPLPVAAGVDFPWLWFRLLVDGVAEPRAAYRFGLYGRNSQTDLYYLFKELERRAGEPVARLGLALRYFAEYGRMLIGREANDTLTFDDPVPAFAELGQIVGGKLRGLAARLPGGMARRRARALAAARAALQAEKPKVTFVCQGNINRSPFAEHLFRLRRPAALAGLAVASAGMLPVIGRASPPNAAVTAARFGVDLLAHRSRHLEFELATGSSLLVVFDAKNARAIERRFPRLATPVLALGDLLDPPVEIRDPDAADLPFYEGRFAEVGEGIDRLIAALLNAGPAVGPTG